MKALLGSRGLVMGRMVMFAVLFFISFFAEGQLIDQAAQENVSYVGPSPNGTALAQFTNIPVSLPTGIPTVEAPLEVLKGRNISVPIGFGYHASGIKVLDLASSVGMGFSLEAGGVITRTMRGLPDEGVNGYQSMGYKIKSTVDTAYLDQVSQGVIDAEPDVFNFNMVGHSGRLVMDICACPIYMTDQGIRVIKHPIHANPSLNTGGWVLKDMAGFTYTFGGDPSSQETTVSSVDGSKQTNTYLSSWYLTAITSPDGGETVHFSYIAGSAVTYKEYRNVTRYRTVTDVLQLVNFWGRRRTRIEGTHIDSLKTSSLNTTVSIASPKYIGRIISENSYAQFNYASRLDLSGGQALQSIFIYNAWDKSGPYKTYALNQSYFLSKGYETSSDPDTKRLKLDGIQLKGTTGEVKQLMTFGYNMRDSLPPRFSNDFDHWGYYTALDTRDGNPPIQLFKDNQGNLNYSHELRAPDATRMLAGMLTKVYYMNGGYTLLNYEPNTYFDYTDSTAKMGGGVRIASMTIKDDAGQVNPITRRFIYNKDDGTTSGYIYNGRPYYVQGIHQFVELKPLPHPGTLSTTLTVLADVASVEPLAAVVLGLQSVSQAGGSGLLIAIFGGSGAAGTATVVLATVFFWVGIAAVAIELVPVVINAVRYFSHRRTHLHYPSDFYKISSIPLNNLFDVNGASVMYSQVTVATGDGSKVKNQYTDWRDYPDSLNQVSIDYTQQVLGLLTVNGGAYAPHTSFGFARGALKESFVYDKAGNLVEHTTNSYQLSGQTHINGMRVSVSGYVPNSDFKSYKAESYFVGFYKEIGQNLQRVQSTVERYDGGGTYSTSQKTEWSPYLPFRVRATYSQRSDGKTLVSRSLYADEYSAGTPFIDSMVSHYMWGLPIEQVTYLQNTFGPDGANSGTGKEVLSGTIYKYRAGGQGLLDTVFRLKAGSGIDMSGFKLSAFVSGALDGSSTAFQKDSRYEGRTFNFGYDSRNNVVQVDNLGQDRVTTVWGYNKTIPIATVRNSSSYSAAYTSFETKDQDSWAFTTSGRDSLSVGKTGLVRYNFSAGAVKTAAAFQPGRYILSYWSTAASKATVTGVSSETIHASGEPDGTGWRYYEELVVVSSQGVVGLTGTGLLDELRLYNEEGLMTTRTVQPVRGVTTSMSASNKATTYQYDGLGRIKVLRDDHYNIIKEYKYTNVQITVPDPRADLWVGVNPSCITDQTHVKPNYSAYNAFIYDINATLGLTVTRPQSEVSYEGEVGYTVYYSDSTSYSGTTHIGIGQTNFTTTVVTSGYTPGLASYVIIDTVINNTDDYAEAYVSYSSRKRVLDGYTEANTTTGGKGYYIVPRVSTTFCPTAFSSQAQRYFAKNDCPKNDGQIIDYTVPAGAVKASSQWLADQKARDIGQAYANLHGICGPQGDTTWVGLNVYCNTVAAGGPPNSANYHVSLRTLSAFHIPLAVFTRDPSEATRSAAITYQITFSDGTTKAYSTMFYAGAVTYSTVVPVSLTGLKVQSVQITSVTGPSTVTMQYYSARERVVNGVADGYTEANINGSGIGTYIRPTINNGGTCPQGTVSWQGVDPYCLQGNQIVVNQGAYSASYFCSDGGGGSSGHCSPIGRFHRYETNYPALVYFSTSSNLGTQTGTITFGVGETDRTTTIPGGSTFYGVNITNVVNTDPHGTNTGQKAFGNRIRLINGIADGYKESNTQGSGLGIYIAPVYDASACPPGN